VSDVDDAEDVPEYDNDDPSGDRQPFLDSPEHKAFENILTDEDDLDDVP
jgi:hypothetical protein